ncbi:Callose synthase 9 [Vitis vinifera]|uniref:Callose synthase 9 n=1 Tax=Vitis vinifera TaxID=29760 RepID=A0A438JVH7_VITVI|nr:Callose synthase 9 [Vitis vinifera]
MQEAANNDNGRAPHSAWRNYDDFNEYFWSLHCFELGWPWKKGSSFFLKPKPRSKNLLKSGGSKHRGKTSFVEHRTFLHLYHSFHRLWIFLFMMFQGLAIIAFNNGHFNSKTIREVLSLGPTFVVMKFCESRFLYDTVFCSWLYLEFFSVSSGLVLLQSSYASFMCMSPDTLLNFLLKALQEESKLNGNSVVLRIYVFVLGIYAGVHIFFSSLMRIPACHQLTNRCDHWFLVRFVKWMHQAKGVWGFGYWEDFLEKSCSLVKWLWWFPTNVVYGIRLLRAFLGHILMDEVPTFWLDGHKDVLGRLLHKSFRIIPHAPALWWGARREYDFGKIIDGDINLCLHNFQVSIELSQKKSHHLSRS